MSGAATESEAAAANTGRLIDLPTDVAVRRAKLANALDGPNNSSLISASVQSRHAVHEPQSLVCFGRAVNLLSLIAIVFAGVGALVFTSTALQLGPFK